VADELIGFDVFPKFSKISWMALIFSTVKIFCVDPALNTCNIYSFVYVYVLRFDGSNLPNKVLHV
jgi:hypothetical protein